jgi:hypothetical protein
VWNNLQTVEEARKISDVADQLANLAQAMETPLEELSMFIDAPMDHVGTPAFYVVAKDQAFQAVTNNLPNKLGVCGEYRANDSQSVAPIFDAKEYFLKYKKGPAVVAWVNNNLSIRTETRIEVAKQPSHGRLDLFIPEAKDISKYDYIYTPDKDYVGLDNFEFQVSVDGEKLSVYYQVKVFPEDENRNYVGYCDWENYNWKISLPTTGTGANAQITLDTDAVGHNWYIDYTPFLNDEYLPTSNPLEWIAKPGSEAEGKMDLLTVLLHEYGHAIGLDHSADSHDLMATKLLPGIRRLPSAEDLNLMAQLLVITKEIGRN